MPSYADSIRAVVPGYDPRHIEAYMRLKFSTLDALSRAEFAYEARIAGACVDEGGRDAAERLARSYGY